MPTQTISLLKPLSLLFFVFTLAACQSHPPIKTEQTVDLKRFMGDWYVIAHIPTFIEDEAYNAVERYRWESPDIVHTTFEFNQGGFEGKRKEYTPTGYVRDNTGGAVWGMEFIWPIKMEYRILYVSPNYQITVIGRTARDFVWIMARTPTINEQQYEAMLTFIEQEGYDLKKLRKVPQQPLAER